jgi:hypothetical protein
MIIERLDPKFLFFSLAPISFLSTLSLLARGLEYVEGTTK